jgi:hypothetical protein
MVNASERQSKTSLGWPGMQHASARARKRRARPKESPEKENIPPATAYIAHAGSNERESMRFTRRTPPMLS